MKFIISESRINQLVLKYLDMNYGNLRLIKPSLPANDRYAQIVDDSGKIYMDGIINQELIVDESIGEVVSELFSLNPFQFTALIKYWTKKKFGVGWGDDMVVVEKIN